MHFHCHVININALCKIPVDGRHLVVAKGYSDDVYSKPSCLALISTMYYFAISQHRHIQIPARNWKWYHPPPTLHPNQTALRQSLPHMKLLSPPQPHGRGRAGLWRMQDCFVLQKQAVSNRPEAGIFKKVSPTGPKSPVPLAGGNQKLLIWHVGWCISDVQVEDCCLQEVGAHKSSEP